MSDDGRRDVRITGLGRAYVEWTMVTKPEDVHDSMKAFAAGWRAAKAEEAVDAAQQIGDGEK
jgi:hypothetical protein